MNTEKVEFANTAEVAKRLDQIGWGIFLAVRWPWLLSRRFV